MVKKDPTLLRYGVLGVCYLGARMYAIDRRQPQMWDGSVNIWGIPIEPPQLKF